MDIIIFKTQGHRKIHFVLLHYTHYTTEHHWTPLNTTKHHWTPLNTTGHHWTSKTTAITTERVFTHGGFVVVVVFFPYCFYFFLQD